MSSIVIFAVFAIPCGPIGELSAQSVRSQDERDENAWRYKENQHQELQRKGRPEQESRNRRGQSRRGMDLGQMFRRIDKNQDGIILADELPPNMRQKFGRMDANGDGQFDRTEQAALIERFNKMRQRDHGPRGDRDNMESLSPEAKERRGRGLDQLLARMDKNRDGQISKDELPEKIQHRFEWLDANGDGFVDKLEQQAAIERMQVRESQSAERKKQRPDSGDSTKGQKPKRPDGG